MRYADPPPGPGPGQTPPHQERSPPRASPPAPPAIKVLNIDYDDPSSFSFETLLRFKSEVDFQRKLSHHPNVRGVGDFAISPWHPLYSVCGGGGRVCE